MVIEIWGYRVWTVGCKPCSALGPSLLGVHALTVDAHDFPVRELGIPVAAHNTPARVHRIPVYVLMIPVCDHFKSASVDK